MKNLDKTTLGLIGASIALLGIIIFVFNPIVFIVLLVLGLMFGGALKLLLNLME